VAARDILLEGVGSGAYTAGTPAIAPGGTQTTPYPGVDPNIGTTATDPPTYFDNNGNPIDYGVFVVGTPYLMSFPSAGGNLTVRAGGNITNEASTAPGGVTGWQLREDGFGSTSTPSWGVNLAAYNFNFGTLGGGDLRIAAGGSAVHLSAAAADSLLPQASGSTLAYLRSGGLSLKAGGDIESAQVFLADGVGSVVAGDGLTATLAPVHSTDPPVGSDFNLQSSSIDVTTRTGAVVDAVFNPTALAQAVPVGTAVGTGRDQTFYTYGDQSSLSIETVTGAITLGSSASSLETLLGTIYNYNKSAASRSVFAPSLSLAALSGNIAFSRAIGSFSLFPSPVGQLDLLAAKDILGNYASTNGHLFMSDTPAASVATLNSLNGSPALGNAFGGDIHAADLNAALVTAGGDIRELYLAIPKSAQVIAGHDIVDLTYLGQNLNPSDETLLSAGHDYQYLDAYSGGGVTVGGPGRLDLLAGRNISLGFSLGVVTTGNLANANLPTAQGADITMYTGLGSNPDFSGFLTQIIDPSSAHQAELVSYVESLQGSSNLTFAAASAAFDALSTDQQRPLIDKVFFNELEASGQAANNVPGAGFKQGYAAIDALFPGSRSGTPDTVAGAFGGDLTLQFSRIYTLSGGTINLLVPGGGIDVGLANPPSTLTNRLPSTLGIVAAGTGDVNIYAKNDINVNSSRIFTLGGGNILIWSDEGSIDAGLGAKTSISAPPPIINVDSNGNVSENFSGAATGSGIRTIQVQPTTPPGNVDLIAPVGSVNAGDAGIGAAGNINIAARSVIGVGNINFGGTATGVPAQVSSIGASLSNASNASSGASNAAANSVAGEAAAKESVAPLAQTALSWLDVFVTGLGEENCKPDDIECLKRQKTPTH
jgi:hypothetical protein